MNKVRNVFVIGLLGSTLLGCGSDLPTEDYKIEVYTSEHEGNALYGDTIASSLYVKHIENHLSDIYDKIGLLVKSFNVTYVNSIGNKTTDSGYDFNDFKDHIIKKCDHIELQKGDIAEKADSTRSFMDVSRYFFNYEIVNQQIIKQLDTCADSTIANYALNLDTISRFSADPRFTQFKSEDLSKELVAIRSDNKLTLSELVSAYTKLDQNIKSTIQNNFIKSN
ncbi:hypothetical protein HLH17_02285 [Acinetobacter sp. ANC 5380]|uniref:Lipoprotein n=1 Tax=Acinetobacter terrae TaxID=2731247 RepID=A0A7Y2RDC3_9GAMM|nr:hypothetical protein [Acinetobacter terrae]NNH76529.1 hypothetical protein [Acinetobacter terrae]